MTQIILSSGAVLTVINDVMGTIYKHNDKVITKAKYDLYCLEHLAEPLNLNIDDGIFKEIISYTQVLEKDLGHVQKSSDTYINENKSLIDFGLQHLGNMFHYREGGYGNYTAGYKRNVLKKYGTHIAPKHFYQKNVSRLLRSNRLTRNAFNKIIDNEEHLF